MTDRTCTRCGKKHLGSFVWLELNSLTGLYATPGTVSPTESQGLFPFGQTCARRALAHERLAASMAAFAADFEQHRDEDPHCTCNGCIAYHAAMLAKK